MRCSCQNCGVYMVQSEDSHLGCVCPECGLRCTACLGTNSVISKETLRNIKNDPLLAKRILNLLNESGEDDK